MAQAFMTRMREAVELETGVVPSVDATADFESFFHDYHGDLFGALWLVTRSRDEAEEVSQDAFLKVWEQWDRVREMDDAVGYLYRTAMNLFRSRYRRARVALRRVIGQERAVDELAEVEAREVVIRALAPLTTRQRAAVVLVDLLEFNSEEAGRALGVKASTVRVLLGRGREALRKGMGETHG